MGGGDPAARWGAWVHQKGGGGWFPSPPRGSLRKAPPTPCMSMCVSCGLVCWRATRVPPESFGTHLRRASLPPLDNQRKYDERSFGSKTTKLVTGRRGRRSTSSLPTGGLDYGLVCLDSPWYQPPPGILTSGTSSVRPETPSEGGGCPNASVSARDAQVCMEGVQTPQVKRGGGSTSPPPVFLI